jgi:signal transduction histidine kinase
MGATRIGRLDAADLWLGNGRRSRGDDIVGKGHAGRSAAAHLWLPTALCVSVIVVQQFHPLAFQAPMLRAIIETELTLCALAAACLFGLSFGHGRQLRNLLLAGALLQFAMIDFVSYVIPASISLASPAALTSAFMLGTLFMAIGVVAGASIGPNRKIPSGRRPLLVTIGASLLAAGIAELGGWALRSRLMGGGQVIGKNFEAANDHPIGLVLAIAATAFLAVTAVRTVRADHPKTDGVTLLLAAAMITFAGACLDFVVLPTPQVAWVTAREGLTILAFGLFFAAALRQEATIRRTIATSAAAAERRRIARDLHDGLAQDLAFIAAHGARIAEENGEDHPLAIAARRALAVSRGAIADLSATEAPTTTAALRQVADELEVRFGVLISVGGDEIDLRPSAREDVIRLVREAIVNAAKAQAQTVLVSLTRCGESYVLRVLDDGVGIGTELMARPGFGVRAMRERAASLGGDLTARVAEDGGTELEVVFP